MTSGAPPPMALFVLRRRFRNQWALFAAALVLFAASSGWLLLGEHERVEQGERERLATQARVLGRNLAEQIESMRRTLEGVREDIGRFRLQSRAAVTRDLDERTKIVKGLRTLLILDTQGITRAANREELVGQNFVQREYFSRARELQNPELLVVSAPFKTVLGAWVINLSMAVAGPDGRFAGVVGASIDSEYVATLMDSVRYAPDMWTALAHGSGRLFMMSPPRTDLNGSDLAQPGSFFSRHLASGKDETLLSGTVLTTGEQRLMAQSTVSPQAMRMDRPLVMAAGRDLGAVFAPWRQRAASEALLLLAMALIGAAVLMFYQRTQRSSHAQLRRADVLQRETEAFNVDVLDSLPQHIAVLDRQGVIVSVNKSWRQFARENDAPALTRNGAGLNYLTVCAQAVGGPSGEEAAAVLAGIRGVLDGSLNEFHLIYPCHSPDEQRWFRLNVTPLHGSHGGVVVSHANITTRREAEVELRRSEARLRQAQHIARLGIWDWDVQSDATLWSEEMFNIYGISAASFTGKGGDYINATHPEDRSMQIENIGKAFQRAAQIEASSPGQPGNGWSDPKEFRIVRPDGSIRWVQGDAVASVNQAGEPISMVGVLVDITERKQAEAARAVFEAQLREAQKMQAIGTLAGGIAHDFNNIIATIIGNADLARQDARSNPLALESLDEIRKAAARARELVRQILAFSRREPTERKSIALAPVVEESGRLLRATLPARVALELHCETGAPEVQANANQIQQVLINLATNAMHAIGADPGKIGIRLDTVLFDAALACTHPTLAALHETHQGRTLRLTVEDDGPGMDAATLERVFEPFFTTKAVDQGTGLGLSVVHGIVRVHEGAIVAESTPGRGSCFTLYLPVAQTQPPQEGAPDSGNGADAAVGAYPPGADCSQHILYLDDDQALVSLVKRLLERHGFRVSGYTDQGEALAALRADPSAFNLVLSDYNMPGMSGLDVARQVRAIRADLPVAITSGFIDHNLRAESDAAGVRELIFKADAMEEFCAMVQRLAQAIERE